MAISEQAIISSLKDSNNFLQSSVKSLCKIIENRQKFLLKTHDYYEIINDFKSVFESLGYSIPWAIYKNAWLAAKELKKQNNIDENKLWFDYSLPYMQQSSELCTLVISGDFDKSKAEDTYCSIVKNVTKDENIAHSFSSSFSLILRSIWGDDIEISNYVKSSKDNIKLFVCGFGWSGSGAVRDYLKEFSKIEAINGESPIFAEGIVSFKSIIESANFDTNLTIEKLVQLFFIVTFVSDLSLTPFRGLVALHRRFKKYSIQYADCVFELSKVIAKIIYNAKNKLQFRDLIPLLGDSLLSLVAAGIPEGKIPLYDNAIMAKNINIYGYLNDIHVFCVQRDPRSNFVARFYENEPLTVAAFVGNNKKYNKEFNKNLSLLSEDFIKKNISIINFEDFVLNEKCRLNILQKGNVSTNDWIYKNKYFDPAISIKNIYNYKQYVNQNEIEEISKSLPELLYSFDDE